MKPERRLETWYRLQSLLNPLSGVKPGHRSPQLNVTLTTVPSRFDRIHITLASLLAQRLKPDRILLWVGDHEGRAPALPRSLERLRRRGVDVRVRPDVGPHTKLVYALREFPDCINVTADDDRLYPRWWLGELYDAYLAAPGNIHCYRAHGMRFTADGLLCKYTEWDFFAQGEQGPSMSLFPTGTGGVLYPPDSLHDEVHNTEAMRELCPKADDVWFKAMSALKGVPVQKVRPRFREFPATSGTQDERLWAHNRTGNDPQIEAVFGRYDLHQSVKPATGPFDGDGQVG